MTAITDALGTAISAEDAAIFIYGVASAYAADSRAAMVREYAAAHRARRAELVTLDTNAGGSAPEAATGYVPKSPIADPTSAIRAIIDAENDCARAYRIVAERADKPDIRRSAVNALSDCAIRTARWKLIVNVEPSTVALPGS